MKLQIIQDSQGKSAGVFIPMEDWALMKIQYPDIENINEDLAQWEKDLIDSRLNTISENPERIKPGKNLLKELKRNI